MQGKEETGMEYSDKYSDKKSDQREERIALLKTYLKRLGEGEELEAVRKDFAERFADVDASEIMCAEQAMIAGGTPITEIQRLCDIHAALFHGTTREEKAAYSGKAPDAKGASDAGGTPDAAILREKRTARTKELIETTGHPLRLFTKENEALEIRLKKAKENVQNKTADHKDLEAIKDLAVHYARKGDLLYPVLKVRYGISGPSDVMWTVDDEIRDEISALFKADAKEPAWQARFEAVLVRAEEMIYKEANILFPNCAANFSKEEWIGIYHDQKDYAECFGVGTEKWEEAEAGRRSEQPSVSRLEIVLAGGHMSVKQLTALLNTMPFEITFVDADNINRYFNEGPKDFKRPQMALDREVFSCHPPKVEEKVRYEGLSYLSTDGRIWSQRAAMQLQLYYGEWRGLGLVSCGRMRGGELSYTQLRNGLRRTL